MPLQRQGPCCIGLMEPGQEKPTEHPTQHTDREEERGPTGDPLRPIGRQPTSRDDAVEVGMVVQRLPPGMQHREKPAVRAQMVRIAGYGQQGLGHRLKEEGIQHPRVVEREWAEEMREGKHHMDVGLMCRSA